MKIYKIKRILNNDVVLVLNTSGNEFIAFGQGIGFKHKKNDYVSDAEIRRKYYSSDNKKLINLFNDIDYDTIRLTERIVKMAEKSLNKKLNDYLLINLADHINFSVQRYKQGIVIQSFISGEIYRFYPQEYEIGKKATEMINQHFDISLDPSEASAIAFHIVNASEGQSIDETRKIMRHVNNVLKIINNTLDTPIPLSSEKFDRLILHLRYFFRNIMFEQVDRSKKDKVDSSQILKVIIGDNLKIKQIINDIASYVSKSLNYQLVDEDKLYLSIHLRKLF